VWNKEAQHQKETMRELFSRIAARYDLVDTLISLGQDQRWRKEALTMTHVPPNGKLLDVATGTGEVALAARKLFPSLQITGVDLTQAMVALALKKAQHQSITWGISDGLALPFPDNTFDAAISAFMMRNVPNVLQAFKEQARVVKPGGRIVCLEITWPTRFPMSLLFKWYFFGWTPFLGRLISGDTGAYTYLPRSVKNFISPPIVAQQMKEAGLKAITWHLKMLGTIAIYTGVKDACQRQTDTL